MNKDWCDQTLTRLARVWPSWIASKGCFLPTDEFYIQLSKYDRIPLIITSLCKHSGLEATATLEIVHDSDLTGLDLVTGRRFDHKEINAAADIQSGSLVEMRMRIAARQLASPRKLARIIAHESTHHFLRVANVHTDSELEEEMFTDVAAIFLGFGKIMLNGASEEFPETIYTPVNISDDGVPYLGYPLIAYSYFFWSKNKGFTAEQTFANVTGPCVPFLRSFEHYHLKGRGLWSRILGCIRSIPPEPDCDGTIAFEQCRKQRSVKYNIIPCRSCSASLRIPKTEKTIAITCPKCKTKFTVQFRPLSGDV